jgi:hypothetical protein
MTIRDLLARGFVEVSRLPQAFSYCTVCKAYRWFIWWDSPNGHIAVCACRECHTIPTSDEKHVQRFQVTVAA